MIAGLILAAGESSRMGQDKALLTYRGRTFLEANVQMLRAAGLERIAVVLGYHAEEIQRAVDLRGIQVVINPNYRQGQTSSLQAGLRALEKYDPEAVLLCLVDHPAVSAEVVKRLLANFRESGAPAVVPTFQGHRGHPVLLSRALFQDLLALSVNQGANSVIGKYRDATQFIAVPDRAILLDVDDPETYHRLQEIP
jgi:molybdenum cofactor cytidylyltransferase